MTVVGEHWAVLEGEDGSLELSCAQLAGQARMAQARIRIGSAVDQVSTDLVDLDKFEFQIRSLADKPVGEFATLHPLFAGFELKVTRKASDTFKVSITTSETAISVYELRGEFDTDNMHLQKFASDLRDQMEPQIP